MNRFFSEKKRTLVACAAALSLYFLALLPAKGADTPIVHTVQTGSFLTMEAAAHEYASLEKSLTSQDLDTLRIEKVGRYYCVRVGMFPTKSDAEVFLRANRSVTPRALITKAFVVPERIRKSQQPLPRFSLDVGVRHLQQVQPSPEVQHKEEERTNARTQEGAASTAAGDTYLKDERLVSAAEAYQRATVQDPDNPEHYLKLAGVLRKMNLINDAVSKLKKAIELSPLWEETYRVELGKLFLQTGRLQEAKTEFFSALNFNPGDGEIHYYLGIVFMKESDYSRAWSAASLSGILGYENSDLIRVLSTLSERPESFPWQEDEGTLHIKHVSVATKEDAQKILGTVSREPVFVTLHINGASMPEPVPSFKGRIKISEVHPKIVEAVRDQSFFSPPVIIETEYGFHIVQRILPITFYVED
jgi:tetratricopeptide (TPR) repeat protein